VNAAPLALAGIGLLFFAGSSRARASSSSSSTGDACDRRPSAAARSTELARLIEWVDCAGRAGQDVAELARLLRRARRADDARAVEARWNARRSVEDAPADGSLELAAAAAAREALEAPTPPPPADEPPRRRSSVRRSSSSSSSSSSTSGVDFSEARRLAPIVARSLRERSGYRGALRRFQAAAGLPVDGAYGPGSRAALRYFGIADPPPARVALDRPEVYEPPAGAERLAPSAVSSSSSSSSASTADGGMSYAGPVLDVPWSRGGAE